MTVLDAAASMEEEITMLEQNWDKHDFFFVHIKKTDSYGKMAILTLRSTSSKK